MLEDGRSSLLREISGKMRILWLKNKDFREGQLVNIRI